MPFEIIPAPSVIHRGPIRHDERFTVEMSTRSRLRFDMARDHEIRPRFRLIQSTWTAEVRHLIEQMTAELNRRGRPPTADEFMVLLAIDEIIAIGRPIIMDVSHGRTAHGVRRIQLRGTPRQLS